MITLGVTGTDTHVGTTVVSCALLAWMRRRGMKVAAMKPVDTDAEGASTRSADAARLGDAAGAGDAADAVCPVRYAGPFPPLLAARTRREPIDLDLLDSAIARLCAGRDAVVVEGAGGLLVPLAPGVGYDALFVRWGLEVVVVTTREPGALSHALLTVRTALHAGLRVRGVVVNATADDDRWHDAADRDALLAELLPGIPVCTFPWLDATSDPVLLADAAESSGFGSMFSDAIAAPAGMMTYPYH